MWQHQNVSSLTSKIPLHLLRLIVMAMMSKTWGVSSLRKLAGQRPKARKRGEKGHHDGRRREGGEMEVIHPRELPCRNEEGEVKPETKTRWEFFCQKSWRVLKNFIDICLPTKRWFSCSLPFFLSSPSPPRARTHRIRGHFHMGPSLSIFPVTSHTNEIPCEHAQTPHNPRDPLEVQVSKERTDRKNLISNRTWMGNNKDRAD